MSKIIPNRLLDEKNQPVENGTLIAERDGEFVELFEARPPHKAGASGKVIVKHADGGARVRYCTVYGLHFERKFEEQERVERALSNDLRCAIVQALPFNDTLTLSRAPSVLTLCPEWLNEELFEQAVDDQVGELVSAFIIDRDFEKCEFHLAC